MNRRLSCLKEAARCLAKAQTDATRREYWMAEAERWTERAAEYDPPSVRKPANDP
jgi:hypothetical protein